MFRKFFRYLGKQLAEYLTAPLSSYEPFALVDPEALRNCLKPCDIVLVEGNSRISLAIKYLTQSTWSHACIYLGGNGEDECMLVEADLVHGVIKVPLRKYRNHNIRVCRAVSLTEADQASIARFIDARLGHRYDLKNIVDLMRYLIPQPPVPRRLRRHMIELGSGDPTKAICSTLIAQAFQSIRYPILPRTINLCSGEACDETDVQILESRHFSHFTPRDFDLSPYFAVVKPTLNRGFDHHLIRWYEEENLKPLEATTLEEAKPG